MDAMRDDQNRILSMIATGAPLEESLTALIRFIESQSTGMLCSVLLLDKDGQHLRHGAAPSLPDSYNKAIDGVQIGPEVGSCGTAAYSRKPVYVTDIQENRLWRNYRGLAAKYDLRACWSTPLIPHDGSRVLGTFAIYYHEVRSPSAVELRLIDIATHIATIAIERRHAERELQRTVSLLQSTLDSAADGILVVDLKGSVVLFNERFKSQWQVPDVVLGTWDSEAIVTHFLGQVKYPEALLKKVRELHADTGAESFDVLELKDGRRFERYSCPQHLNGKPAGRIWNFRDVTERMDLQDRLRQAQKMEAFGQLAGGVAHDFNNILTVILGNASILQLPEINEANRASAVLEIVKSAERAANLTRQLLTFSHRQPIQARNIDLNEVVMQITTMLQRLIGEHISLETIYAPGGSFIHADRSMMEQVLVNLAVNSRDAMPRGGLLRVQTAAVTLDERMAQAKSGTRTGEFIRLSVTDTGHGIAPEHLPHIFEPFFTTKEVGKGTGLGLATVFSIIEQHHGWIDVESKLNRGTTLDIFLPRLPKNAASLAEHKAKPALPRGTETILLAEDDLSVREFVQATLVFHGYKVHAAASGAAALHLWEMHKDSIDLLVTDMVMPEGISGRELADRIKAQKQDLKVIYCSGYTDDMLGESSLLRKNVNFLEKPFNQSVLLQRVRDCLDSQ